MKEEYNLKESNEQALFKQYFDEYYKPIRHYIYYKSGDVDIADDFTQQVFLKLWEIRKNIKQETVKALLYAIATNLLRNHYKHQKVVLQFTIQQNNDEQTTEAADFDLQQQEFNTKLTKVLDLMPEKSKEIFLMNRIEGLTYSEIANRLDVSVKAIEKRMHQALGIVKENISYKI